jgi:hypothetical protein
MKQLIQFFNFPIRMGPFEAPERQIAYLGFK